LKSPKAPKESPEAAVLRARQITDLAKLDEQENIKIKRMLNASRGARVFAGSPSSRAAAGDSAGRALYSSRGSTGGSTGGGSGAGSGTRTGPRKTSMLR
jgi:hypothetical protein